MQQLSPPPPPLLLLPPWKSATPASRCLEMIFNRGFFGVVSVARRHALTAVKVRLFFSDYVTRKCLF